MYINICYYLYVYFMQGGGEQAQGWGGAAALRRLAWRCSASGMAATYGKANGKPVTPSPVDGQSLVSIFICKNRV